MTGIIMKPVENSRPAIIQPVTLRQEGIAYIQSSLAEGGSISSLVKQLFGAQGECFAPLEEGTTLEQAEKFKVGSSMPTEAIRRWIANYIISKWGNAAQLIFADPWIKTNDMKRGPIQPYFSIANTLYRFPQDGDVYSRLSDGAKGIVTWNFVVYVIAPTIPIPQSAATMPQGYAELVARNTQAILASAYDHEGYVLWEKQTA